MKSPTALATFSLLAALQPAAHAGPATAPTTRPAGPLVVLDAGHGGTNAGAQGIGGLSEKQLTLVLAKRVAERLHHRRIATRLTRTDDRTLTLRQRIATANHDAADLFVSIHANASPNRVQRGFETFVLTAAGVDIDGRALRSEVRTPRPRPASSATFVSPLAGGGTPAAASAPVDAETALILDDVERGASQWEAAELAVRMQRSLRAVRGKAGDRGVRQDAHHVLLGATMPAVLVEVGFVDHPIEGKQLADAAVQDEVASAIADAIEEQLAMTD